MDKINGTKVQPDGKLRVSRPIDADRRCPCGRKISRYNPNENCWQHAPLDYGRIRGRYYDKED